MIRLLLFSTDALYYEHLQGDTSGCFLGFVDIKREAVFHYEEDVLKRNLCFDVNKTFGRT